MEDEFYIADDVKILLESMGAKVIGPLSDLESAEKCLEAASLPDLAVLDINLRGDLVFSLAAGLRDHEVPMIFATGYDDSIIPPEHAGVPRLEKPFEDRDLTGLVLRLLDRTRRG
ncbi:response regulator [Geminicoccus roseus]|uniref:response regulator n=1 Tax=Geminicoccus roseus TaxID=404900 RepID=UPI000688AFC5|nr:response regulator [Geminicoccus roseus]